LIAAARGAALIAAAALACASASAAASDTRAAGGTRLVQSLEASPLTIVALVEGAQVIDSQSRRALLRVEQAVNGEVPTGSRIPVVWEERSRERADRFANGDRILVSLLPLPQQSIWLQRLPDPEERTSFSFVAERGNAFLRSPTVGGVDLLRHYALLSPSERTGPLGVGTLIQLATGAQLPLASSAIERLDQIAELDAKLDPPSSRRLVVTMLRSDAGDGLATAVIELIGRHHLEAVRSALEARLAAAQAPAEAVVYRALGRLDGELSPERTDWLLENGSAEYRETAARFASGPDAGRRLGRLLKRDQAPAVRSAAVERLVVLRGKKAADAAAGALEDPSADVRHAAARAMGSLGAGGVPALRGVVDRGSQNGARAAMAGLVLSQTQESVVALIEISGSHPDEGIRLLAKIALAQPIGHDD